MAELEEEIIKQSECKPYCGGDTLTTYLSFGNMVRINQNHLFTKLIKCVLPLHLQLNGQKLLSTS